MPIVKLSLRHNFSLSGRVYTTAMRTLRSYLFLVVIFGVSLTQCLKTETASPDDLNQTDREFILAASLRNGAILQLADTAVAKTTDSAIKRLADTIGVDYSNLETDFTRLANGLSFYFPDSLDAKQLAFKLRLDTLNGRIFDSVYIHQLVVEHDSAIASFNKQVAEGFNIKLKQFSTTWIPVLQRNRKTADSIAKLY